MGKVIWIHTRNIMVCVLATTALFMAAQASGGASDVGVTAAVFIATPKGDGASFSPNWIIAKAPSSLFDGFPLVRDWYDGYRDYSKPTHSFGQAMAKAPSTEKFASQVREMTVNSSATDNWEDAYAACNELASEYPEGSPQYLRCIAGQLKKQQNYAEAIAVLKQAIAAGSETEDKELLRQMRETLQGYYKQAGDWSGAIPVIQDMIQRYPDHAAASYYYLSQCYDALRDRPAQMAALEAGIAAVILPKDLKALQTLRAARAWRVGRDVDPAKGIAECEALIADFPSAPNRLWQYWIGLFQLENGEREKAMEIFHWLIANHPESGLAGEASMQLASCLAEEGKLSEGLAVLDKFYQDRYVEDLHEASKALYWMAELLGGYGHDCASAIELLDQLAVTCQNYDQEWCRRAAVLKGLFLLGQKETMAARSLFTTLLDKPGFDNVELTYRLACCDFQERDYPAAELAFRSVSDNHPNSAYAVPSLYMVGESRVKMGDLAGARAAFEEVIQNGADKVGQEKKFIESVRRRLLAVSAN